MTTFNNHGLVSLWDMLEFKAEPFLILIKRLQTLRIGLAAQPLFDNHKKMASNNFENHQSMVKSALSKWGNASEALRQAKTIKDEAEKSVDDIKSTIIDGLDESLSDAIEQCKVLNLNFSLKLIEDIYKKFKEDGINPDGRDIDEILNRVKHEIGINLFLLLSSESQKYYDPQEPFGKDVSIKFSSLIYDIDEAHKSYALERNTASVYHSVRCLEGGIRALYRCMGIAEPTKGCQKNWHFILDEIEKAIKVKWPSATDKMLDDYIVISGFHAALSAMKDPYRNPTMHLDSKYDSEDALYYLQMIKGFMCRVAKRMDEQGLPKA